LCLGPADRAAAAIDLLPQILDGVVIDDAGVFNERLREWEDFYNFNRPHGGLGGQTPYERLRQKTGSPV
jgi:transposase InsO family protein